MCSEEHEGQGVLVFLREFVLHAGDGCAEEEGDEVLVGAIGSDLLEGGDVGGTIFKADDEQGVVGAKQDEVGEQTTRTAITITEGVQVFVVAVPFGSNYHGVLAAVEGFLRGRHEVGHTGYQRFVVAKHGVTSSHILRGVFAGNCSRGTVAKCMLRHQSVYLFQ